MAKKRIVHGARVPVKLRPKDRELICTHTLADADLTNRLNLAVVEGRFLRVQYTLDELDQLLGWVAAEANHTKDKKLGTELDALYERVEEVLDSYDEVGA